MKITADKKHFIIENQFDKLPSEIIDYIYFFVEPTYMYLLSLE